MLRLRFLHHSAVCCYPFFDAVWYSISGLGKTYKKETLLEAGPGLCRRPRTDVVFLLSIKRVMVAEREMKLKPNRKSTYIDGRGQRTT